MGKRELGVFEAEAVVLGHIINDDQYMERALAVMKRRRARDFSCRANFLIFKVMRFLARHEMTISFVTTLERLREVGALSVIGEFHVLDLVIAATTAVETFDEAVDRLDQQRVAVTPVEVVSEELSPFGAGKEEYKRYLASEKWQELRRVKILEARGRCQLCYSPNDLEVHHRTYDRKFHEDPSDLTVLCHNCHDWYTNHRPVVVSTVKVKAKDFQNGLREAS